MGVYSDKLKLLAEKAPKQLSRSAEFTSLELNLLFDFLEEYTFITCELMNYTALNYDKNIKNNHQAKLQYEELGHEISSIHNCINLNIASFEKILELSHNKDIVESTLSKTYFNRRKIMFNNLLITQINNHIELLLKKILECGSHLYSKNTNRSNNYN
jgi:hypothetical protein